MTLAEKLLMRRQALALTQQEVATKIHVSRQAISNWELGKNYPDLETLIKISEVYHISLDALLKDDNVFVKQLQKGAYMEKLKYGVYLSALLSVLITFIVDFSVNRTFTWSLIVALSFGCLSLAVFIFTIAKRKKLLKTSLVLTALVPVFLFLLEKILKAAQFYTPSWFGSIGLPLSALWLSIFWLVALVHFKRRQNGFLTGAMLSLVAIPGNLLTQLIILPQGDWRLPTLINSVASLLLAICLFYLAKRFPQQNT